MTQYLTNVEPLERDRQAGLELYRVLTNVAEPDASDPEVAEDISNMAIGLGLHWKAAIDTVLAELYRRFWAIADLHRKGRLDADGEDDARAQQRMICVLYSNISQGLHDFDPSTLEASPPARQPESQNTDKGTQNGR